MADRGSVLNTVRRLGGYGTTSFERPTQAEANRGRPKTVRKTKRILDWAHYGINASTGVIVGFSTHAPTTRDDLEPISIKLVRALILTGFWPINETQT